MLTVSIITPSFRQSDWLRLCVASVADQGIGVEHIVQDAGSDDGTLDWLRTDPRVNVFVEKDAGMYDAINRGLRRARGEILAYLNCDEQYLPGTLRAAVEFFERHPEIDVVFGDVVMVNDAGEYLGYRKVQPPLLYHTWVCHLSTLSCATFFRRKLVDAGFLFNPEYRCGGDGEWMVRLLQNNVRMAALRRFTSAFTMTGANLSRGERAREEWRRLRNTAPSWVRMLAPLWVAQHRVRRLVDGSYFQGHIAFEIYTKGNVTGRVVSWNAEMLKRWNAETWKLKPEMLKRWKCWNRKPEILKNWNRSASRATTNIQQPTFNIQHSTSNIEHPQTWNWKTEMLKCW
jgi:glycosyltransferase involved in cell wall biosynthesis